MAEVNISKKSGLAALFFCMFFGWMGGHRFYVGKYGTGLLMFFTMGGLGLWWFIDFIMIIGRGFKDKNDLPLKKM